MHVCAAMCVCVCVCVKVSRVVAPVGISSCNAAAVGAEVWICTSRGHVGGRGNKCVNGRKGVGGLGCGRWCGVTSVIARVLDKGIYRLHPQSHVGLSEGLLQGVKERRAVK